jgi:Tol biopolymer transport system component
VGAPDAHPDTAHHPLRRDGAVLTRRLIMTTRRLFVLALLLAAVPAAAEPPRGSITIERIADIKYPTNPAWSPDGRKVAFLWDAAGKQDLFVTTPGSQPVALTDFPVDPDLLQSDLGAFAWISNDEILFGRYGQLWKVNATSGKPARIPGALADAGAFSLSPDRQTIAFIRRGNIWIGNVSAGTERQVTSLPEGLSAGVPVFSMDGRWLAFVATRGGLEPEELPWNGGLVRSMETVTRERRLGVVAVQGGDAYWIPTVGAVSFPQFAADRSLVYYELSPDGKTKDIKVTMRDAPPRVLWRDRDERWVSPTNRDVKLLVSPDGKQVAFVSDRSGWIHVYVMPADATSEAQAVQLTSGNFGAGLGSWSPDSKRIAYHHSAAGNQMERFVDVVDVATKHGEPVVTTRGVNLDPLFSPDGQSIVIQRTDPQNSLDLYVASIRAGAPLTRLSDSMPTGLNRTELVVPEPVSFPSRLDKAPVPGTIMVPRNLDKSRKHPAIVWIHGSGSDQNFIGWHPGSYRMYYSASVYLAQQGTSSSRPTIAAARAIAASGQPACTWGSVSRTRPTCWPAPTI